VITPEKLAELARETEIETGKGAARRGGKWKVTLADSRSKEAASALLEKLHAAGYAAETRRREDARTSCESRNCRRRRRPKRWRRACAASTA
jgi:predicted ArsR family transcriptional regulator